MPADTTVRRVAGSALRPGDILHTVTGLQLVTQIIPKELCVNVHVRREDGHTQVRGIGQTETVLASRPGGWGDGT